MLKNQGPQPRLNDHQYFVLGCSIILFCISACTVIERDEDTQFEAKECGETQEERTPSPEVDTLDTAVSGVAYRKENGEVEIVLSPMIDARSGQVIEEYTSEHLQLSSNDQDVESFTLTKVNPDTPAAVDVVFVIDSTGSMAWALDGVKIGVNAFAQGLESSGLNLQFAAIEFGDEVRSSIPLGDAEAVSTWLTKFGAEGGGDGPESPLDALVAADTQIDFRPDALRYYIVITDVGFHERSDGSKCSDFNLTEVVDRFRGQALFAVVYASLGGGVGVDPNWLTRSIGGLFFKIDIQEALASFNISTDNPTDDVLKESHVIRVPAEESSEIGDEVQINYTRNDVSLSVTLEVKNVQ